MENESSSISEELTEIPTVWYMKEICSSEQKCINHLIDKGGLLPHQIVSCVE